MKDKIRHEIELIVEENFKGLSDFIDDKDTLDWYKALIVECIDSYSKSDIVMDYHLDKHFK